MLSKSYRERFEYTVPFIEDYAPKTWAYLNKFEGKLRKRVDGRYKKKARLEHKWYELFQTSYLNLAENQRALIQILAKRTSTTIDVQPFIFQAGGKGGGLYGIMPTESAPNVNFFVGIFNSDIANFYLCQISSVYSGGYYSYGDQFIKNLPIPPATEAQQSAIAGSARTLTETTARRRELAAAVAAFPDSVTAARREAGDVPDLEALERVGQFAGLPREVRADKMTSEHDLTGQVVMRVGNGRMTLGPDLAELVEAVLTARGKLSYEVLAALQVPDREAEQRSYTASLRAWQAEIVELANEIRQLEDELNSRVYEVYGLEDDKEVIEGFLERF